MYRARDTKLERDVAIKVLPDEFSQNEERLARFEREAKLLAQVNHTNIATLFGFEEQDGQQFLVMELVEGETLAEKIARGPIPLEQVVPLFLQIAEGLEAAHEKGIVHRDLKPANMKIGADGKIQILDFGLAKAFLGDARVEMDNSMSPTLTKAGSRLGAIMGTPSYMSPEQARGEAVDKRTDIWAFGCVLYEALTGRKAFSGDSVTDILAAVINTDPNFGPLPVSTPRKVRELLRRCLQRDARRRLRDIGDAWTELTDAGEAEGPDLSAPAMIPKGSSWSVWGGLGIVLFLLGLGLGAILWSTDVTIQGVRRLAIELHGEQRLGDLYTNVVALSPDGTGLVYSATSSDGVPRLYLRSLDEREATPIPGTEGADGPFFSPNGRWIGFSADGQLKKVSLEGGAPITISERDSLHGASWGPDNNIVFTPGSGLGLARVSADGGVPETITTPDLHAGGGHQRPSFLPDGKSVLFDVVKTGVAVLDLDTGEWKVLLEQGMEAKYAASGHLVFARGASLLAIAYDMERLETRGGPVTVLDGVRTGDASGAAHYDLARDGTLAFLPGELTFTAERRLVWVDRQGNVRPLTDEKNAYAYPRLSPDGKRLAVIVRDGIEYVVPAFSGGSDIWIYEFANDTLRRLTFDGRSFFPIWSPDSKDVVFISRHDDSWQLLRKSADGSGDAELLRESDMYFEPNAFSPDGERLFFSQPDPNSDWDIWTLQLLPEPGPERREEPFIKTDGYEDYAQPSPGGRWVAYTYGDQELFVESFLDRGGKWQISAGPVLGATWSSNGEEILVRDVLGLSSVAIRSDPSFSSSRPRTLFDAGAFDSLEGGYRNFAASADGTGFVFIEGPSEDAPRSIGVVLNWFQELERLVPTTK